MLAFKIMEGFWYVSRDIWTLLFSLSNLLFWIYLGVKIYFQYIIHDCRRPKIGEVAEEMKEKNIQDMYMAQDLLYDLMMEYIIYL